MEKTVAIDLKKCHPKITRTSTDSLVISLKDCIRKIKQSGKVICTVCCKCDSDVIAYSKGGLGTPKQNMGKRHVLKVITEVQCYKLPGAASAKSAKKYGAPPAYYGARATNTNPLLQAMVHVADRAMN